MHLNLFSVRTLPEFAGGFVKKKLNSRLYQQKVIEQNPLGQKKAGGWKKGRKSKNSCQKLFPNFSADFFYSTWPSMSAIIYFNQKKKGLRLGREKKELVYATNSQCCKSFTGPYLQVCKTGLFLK